MRHPSFRNAFGIFGRVALATAVVAALGVSGVARADGDTGCGLGSQVWQGQSSVPAKVLAATTNGTLGNQTFGISSGTLGCEPGSVIKAENQLPMFAGGSLDRLARDMAVGQGESLETLAHLYGIAETDRPAFFELTRTHFDAIFPTAEITAGDLLDSIDHALSSDPRLAHYARS